MKSGTTVLHTQFSVTVTVPGEVGLSSESYTQGSGCICNNATLLGQLSSQPTPGYRRALWVHPGRKLEF